MPTNFPTSVDVLTNPVSNDSLNSPSHSAQHANANDAIEAVESFLLNGGQGLTLIKSQVVTGGAIVTVTDVFSATYTAYKIVISDLAATGSVGVGFQLSTVNSGYYENLISTGAYGTASGNVTFNNTNGGTSYDLGIVATGSPDVAGGVIELQNPFTATTTNIQGFGSDPRTGGFAMRFNAGYHATRTSYTSFSILISGQTFTAGRINVYGYGRGA